MIAASARLATQVGWLGLLVSSQLALLRIHQMNWVNSCVCNDCYHNMVQGTSVLITFVVF